MVTKRNIILPVMAEVCHFVVFACIVPMAYLGGCSSNEELQRLLDEKGRLEIEHNELRQELVAFKQDWATLQNEDSSAKLIQELREELRKAAGYKSTTQRQLNSNIETIKRLRSENSMLRKKNEQANNTLNELRSKLATYQRKKQATINQRLKSSVYAGVGSGHWILENVNAGELIKLEDSSLWEISPIDRIYSALWLPISEITVIEGRNPFYPYVLINSDDDEKAEAKFIAGIRLDKSTVADEVDAPNNLIESRIDGDFEGWDGDTIFKLTNGQIWQQVSYNYTYHYAFMPNVLIYSTTGGYKMKVDGVQQTIYVKRLK